MFSQGAMEEPDVRGKAADDQQPDSCQATNYKNTVEFCGFTVCLLACFYLLLLMSTCSLTVVEKRRQLNL